MEAYKKYKTFCIEGVQATLSRLKLPIPNRPNQLLASQGFNVF